MTIRPLRGRAGIPVTVRPGALTTVALLTLLTAGAALPARVPGSAAAYTLAGLAAATGLMAFLALSELAAARAARRAGQAVQRVEVGLAGATTRATGPPASPGGLMRAALAAPTTLAACSLATLAAASVLHAYGPDLPAATAGWVGQAGLVLAAVSLLPAGPLPGGQVLSAVLWRRGRGQLTAHLVAARTGRTVGAVLLLVGAAGAALVAPAGLWLVLLGAFVLLTSTLERNAARTRQALAGVHVGDVMTPRPVVGPADRSVAAFLERVALPSGQEAFALHGADGRITGLVTLPALYDVPGDDRSLTRVGRVAVPLDAVPTGRPDEPLCDLLDRVAGRPATGGWALVLDGDGHAVGVVGPADFGRALQLAPVFGGGAPPSYDPSDRRLVEAGAA